MSRFTQQSRIFIIAEHRYQFSYQLLQGRLIVNKDGEAIAKPFIWLPFQRLDIDNGQLQVVCQLLPWAQFRLFFRQQLLCQSLFPGLYRYTLVTLILNWGKRLLLALTAVFS